MIDPNVELMLDEEAGYSLLEDEGAQQETDPYMLATLGGKGGRRLARILGQRSKRTFEKVKTQRAKKAKGPTREDLDALASRLDERYGEEMDEATAMRYQADWEAQLPPTEKRTPERINIERHIEGARADIRNVENLVKDPITAIEQMQTAEDMAKLLEVAGRHQQLAEPPRTHASIEEATDDAGDSLKILQDALKIEGGGLLNDKQLHAARRWLSTVGRQTVDFARQIKEIREKGDNPSGELILEYQRSLEAFTTLHAFVKGQAREVARALAQQRMIANTLEGAGFADITNLVDSMGGSHNILRHAELIADIEAGDESTFLRQLAEKSKGWVRTGMGLAVEWWKSNILSGPQTHLVNTMSNTATQLYEDFLVRGVAAGIGEARAAAGKAVGIDVKNRVTLNEYIAGHVAGTVGLADGLEAFWRTLRTGDSYFSDAGTIGGKSEQVGISGEWQKLGESIGGTAGLAAGGGKGAEIGGSLGHAAGTGATFSFRLLESEDEFFKVVAFRKELTRLAIRDGLERGMKGDELTKHLDDVFADPEHYGLLKPASDYARQMTFTDQDVGGLAGTLMDIARTATERHPYLQFLVPFIRTPMNLVRYSIENTGFPTAVLSERMRRDLMAGGAARDIAMAKLGIGTALTVGVYNFYNAGLITGSGPDDPATRKLWEKAGWRQSAIKIGDNWYSYNRTDPFGTTLGAMADYMDRANYNADKNDFQRYFMAAVFTAADHTFDATYMRGANEMFQVITGRKSFESWVSNMAVPMVKPYAMAQKTYVKTQRGPERGATDEINRSITTEFKNRIKMFEADLAEEDWPRPSRYWDASAAIPREGEVGYEAGNDLLIFGLSPIQRRKAEEDPVSQELAFNGVKAGEPSSMFTTPGSRTKISLFALDEGRGRIYDEYFKVAGKMRRDYVTKFLDSGAYQRNKDKPGMRGFESEASAELRSLISRADREARDLFLYGKPGEKSILWQLINEQGMPATDFARQIANDYSGLDKDIYKGLVTQEDVEGQAKIKTRGAHGAPAPMQAIPAADRKPGPTGPHF